MAFRTCHACPIRARAHAEPRRGDELAPGSQVYDRSDRPSVVPRVDFLFFSINLLLQGITTSLSTFTLFTHIKKMDSLGMSGMNDPKTQVMRQIQQEAAMQNARMLVEVCYVVRMPLNYGRHLIGTL